MLFIQVFGVSNSATVNDPSLLLRPQEWTAPATFLQTRQDPHAMRGFFVARHQKQRTKLYCFPISLALLADRREKVQWWSLWAHASFYHLQMFAVLVPQPWSSPCPLQPIPCYIQSPPPLQPLKGTAEDNLFKQRCRLASKLWQQLPWGLCKFSASWGQGMGWITRYGGRVFSTARRCRNAKCPSRRSVR